jgi:hypothetical protein
MLAGFTVAEPDVFDFETFYGLPVYTNTTFTGENGPHCRNALPQASDIAGSLGLDQARRLLLKVKFLSISTECRSPG